MPRTASVTARFVVLLGLAFSRLPAQSITPAKAGLISYSTGNVYLDDKPIERSATRFAEVKANAVVRTEAGRVEVLLAPCMVLRIGEKSAFRMIDTQLIDTQIEWLAGSAVADIGNIANHTSLTLLLRDAAIVIAHRGTYHLDAAPPRLKVFEGKATVRAATQVQAIDAGRMIDLDAATLPVKFDKRDTDALDAWSKSRSALLARALSGQRNRDAQKLSAAASASATTAAGDPNPPLAWEMSRAPSLAPPPPPVTFPAGVPANFGCRADQ
jgi:hypothetical protein